MPSFHAVIESDHEIQNPTSPEKTRLLGKGMHLGSGSSVLDVGSGRGGPAMILAETFSCRITCVEKGEEFDSAARKRALEAGLDSLIELVRADARDFSLENEHYDAAICLGASFIWEGLAATLAALDPAIRRGGFIAVGEPYWRTWPLPEKARPEEREDFLPLPETIQRFRGAGLDPVILIDASLDDWDRYVSLHWLAAEKWLTEHPDDDDAEDIRLLNEHFRDRYLLWQRELLGWVIIAGRKR